MVTREVCLDGRSLALPHGTGVATYARSLATGLGDIGRAPAVLLEGPRAGRAARWVRSAWPGSAGASSCPPPEGFRRAWQAPDAFRLAQTYFDVHGRLLRLRCRTPPALMHWTYPLPLAFHGAPNIYTIHDLLPISDPRLTDIDGARFTRIARRIADGADHIVTVSEASRSVIIDLLGVAASRVTNTYQPPCVPDHLHAAPPPSRRGHFLFCGTIERRKNIGRLVAAHQASGAGSPLILAGPDGFQAAAELAAGGADVRPLAEMPAMPVGGVWRAPWLERPDLLELLRGARALLFPSLAEGFGLPIVEAMALGVPVLTSAGGATGEVAGDAALLVDPYDGAALAAAIAALDRDVALCDRLAADGRRRGTMFSKAACLARLATVYDMVGAASA